VVPFQITGCLFSISGSIQERVVREAGSQKLDFYYHITNAAGSNGVVNALTIRDFGRFTAAAAFRPDSLGTVPALSAGRDISGSTVQIFPQVIAPGSSSFFILLMTNATTYDSQGTLTIIGVNPQMPWFRGHVQLATDQPTG
jgi:hypothetical protein